MAIRTVNLKRIARDPAYAGWVENITAEERTIESRRANSERNRHLRNAARKAKARRRSA